MPRYSRHDEDDWAPSGVCPECKQDDPQKRTMHHLQLARGVDVDTLRAHLMEQYVKLRDREKQRPDLVDDICRWVGHMIEQFSGFPDDITGQAMPWWKARDAMIQSQERLAREAYARAPEVWRARKEGRPIPGFHRAKVTPQGRWVPEGQPPAIFYEAPQDQMREPGEDDID